MKDLFGKKLKREELIQYVGNMSQIAGATLFEYKGGRAEGVKGIEVKTGTGFRFVVLPDRALDIASAEFCGKPLAWMCQNGIVNPKYFENGGLGFLRSFTGGMVTTCGLTQVGASCKDGEEALGIHGRISHIPTEKFSIDEFWEKDEYIISINGQMREVCLYAENLLLKRKISCKMSESKVLINDVVTNEGFHETPFMIIYHINFGFPVVSEKSKLWASSTKVEPWIDAKGNPTKGVYNKFEKPTPDYSYKLFLHQVPKDKDKAYFGIINESIDFGAYVKIDPRQLPYVTEWKMMGQQAYVVAIEPGNCIPEGRVEAAKNNRLSFLRPGEQYEIKYEIGVLEDRDAINGFKERL